MTSIETIKEENKEMRARKCGPTNYYENLVYDLDLDIRPGQTGWFVDNNDRFVVVMATFAGNVVFFQRYTDTMIPIAYNAPEGIEAVLPMDMDWRQVLRWAGFRNNMFHKVVEELKELEK